MASDRCGTQLPENPRNDRFTASKCSTSVNSRMKFGNASGVMNPVYAVHPAGYIWRSTTGFELAEHDGACLEPSGCLFDQLAKNVINTTI